MLPDELALKHQTGVLEETNTRNYLETGNMQHLKNKGDFEIPYPNPERLASILSLPEIKQILPANINPQKPTGRLDRLTGFLLLDYYIFIFAGLTILAILITAKALVTKQLHDSF
jgi:hypothetical protein